MAKPFPKEMILNYVYVDADLNVKFKICLHYSTQHTLKKHGFFTVRLYHNFERYPYFPRKGILFAQFRPHI